MKVSVVIPVFNGENYIDHSIKSCLIQDEVGEIIVIDDGSLDSTCEIVQKLGNLDQRIILKKLDKNYGSSKARNIGIDLSNCELISFLDADDYFLPNRFAKGINCLKKYPEIHGTYEPIKNFFEKNYKYSREAEANIVFLTEDVKETQLFDYLIKDNKSFFSIISLILRSESIKGKIYFDEDFKYGQDIDYLYNVTRNLILKNANVKEIKILRRIHNSNVTSSIGIQIFNPRKKLIDKWFKILLTENFTPKQARYLVYRKICYDLLDYRFLRYIGGYVSKFIVLTFLIFKHPKICLKLM